MRRAPKGKVKASTSAEKGKEKDSKYKSSLIPFIEMGHYFYLELPKRPKLLAAAKECPFWGLFEPFYKPQPAIWTNKEIKAESNVFTKVPQAIEMILNCYNSKITKQRDSKGFYFGEKAFLPTPENFAVIFGMQRVVEPDDLNEQMAVQNAECEIFFHTHFPTKGQKVTRKMIESKLRSAIEDEEKPECFLRLFGLWLCKVFFFTDTSGSNSTKKWLPHLFLMNRVSWPDHIVNYLINHIQNPKGKSGVKSVAGCTTFLLYWFLEHSNYGTRREDFKQSTPRFLRWHQLEFCNKLVEDNKDKVNMMSWISQEFVLSGTFIDPLEEGERCLTTRVKIRQAISDRIGAKKVRVRDKDNDSEMSLGRNAARYSEDLAPVSQYKRRKVSIEESRPCEGKEVCNDEPGHLPSSESMMPAIPILLTQGARAEEKDNDVLHASVKNLHGNARRGNLVSSSEADSMGVELLEVVEIVDVSATTDNHTSKCQTPDSTLLRNPTSVDVIPSHSGSTSASPQERVDGFEFVDNLKIPEEYQLLYKKISDKYGHIATRNFIKSDDDLLLTCVASLLKIISEMETVRGGELTTELLGRWEASIQFAEAFKFNVMWLRKGFNRLKNHQGSICEIDKEVESHEQILDAMQVQYAGFWKRKDELNSELSEIEVQIRKAAVIISSEREAIEETRTQKIKFQTEPVLGIVLE